MSRRLHSLFGSLKFRLALAGFVLIAASVALTVVLVLRPVEERTQRAALDAELANAERIAVVLSAKLVALQTSMRSAAAQLPADRLDDVPALHAWLLREGVLRGMFDSVFVVAASDARMRVGSDAKGVHDWSVATGDRAYVQRTLRERRPVISEPVASRISGEPVLVMTMPVFDAHGTLVAILGGALRLGSNALLEHLTRRASDGHDPVATIVTDAAGRVVAHPDPSWMMRDARADGRFRAVVARWMSQGRPIDPQGSSLRLGADIVAMAGVPDADWVVFRSAPAELLLGGPADGQRQAMLIGSVVAIAGGLIILLVMLRLLRPLRQLELRALRLLSDDIAAEDGWPRAGGELGELARVFRHVMKERAAIRKSGDELFEKMHAVMANSPVGIAFTRLGRFELASAQFARMFGYDAERLQGMGTHVISPSRELHAGFTAEAALAFAAGRGCDAEHELVRADGSRFWARLQGAPVRAADLEAGTIWICTDITESRRQREQLSWTASHDELTGLVNRREFEHRLARALAGERSAGGPLAALFIDLDRFKAVNDNAGHAAGDEMLRRVAAVLGERARSHDTVARIGGDEFALLLRDCETAAAERVAADICQRVAELHLDWLGQRLQVGASIGVVAVDAGFHSVESVLHAADAACYEAKRAGRGAVRTHGAPGAPFALH
jgi:diguanylate cyclase (GGDEF)-like protein/PAS domain S-box-containing protein